MFDSIEFETDKLLIHGFRPQDITGLENMACDVYEILSDRRTLKYLPEKRLGSEEEALLMLRGNILSFFASKNYLHFIRVKTTGRIIGMIDLISPETVREHYRLSGRYPYFIEFYLMGTKGRHGIMAGLLPFFLAELRHRRVCNTAAIVNRRKEGIRAFGLCKGINI